MKKQIILTAAVFLGAGCLSAQAQLGGRAHGPAISDAMAKLFGEHQQFIAKLEMESEINPNQTVTMPGKITFDAGKVRFEMNLSQMQGSAMPPQAAEQMKAMGMDSMISITRPDKNTMFIIYPNMQSYVENPIPQKNEPASADDFKLDKTELGKESADGHDCVKYQVIVTDRQGTKHESTVWNAADLKDFPVKIVTTEQGHKATLHFKDVTFSKPEAAVFEAPSGFKKYTGMQQMMQEVMMKKMGGMPGMMPHGQ